MNPRDFEWYYITKGQLRGPITGSALYSEQIKPGTLVWCKGMTDWSDAIKTPLGHLLFGTPPPLYFEPIKPSILLPSLASDPIVAPSEIVERSEINEPEGLVSKRWYSFVSRYWRGEYSIARSFWIYCISLSAGFRIIATFLDLGDVRLRVIAWITLIYFGFSYCTQIWQIVGLYRSLKKHRARGGSLSGVAFGCVGLGLIVFWSSSLSLSTVFPQSAGMIEILRGDPSIGRLKIELLPSGTEVEISGGIPEGCAEEFRLFIEKTPSVKTLHIESIGGRVYEAKAIAKIVNDREMTTYVSHHCLSAATIIFLAGKERYLLSGAKLGFHAASFPGLSSADSKATNNALRDGMTRVGITPEFATKAQNTPNLGMWYPDVPELLDAHVITGQTYGERFGVSSATLRSLAQTEEYFLDKPFFRAIRDYDPKMFMRILEIFRNALERGASEGEALGKINNIITSKSQELLPYVSDEIMGKMLDLWILVIDQCGDAHPEEVLSILFNEKVEFKRNMLRVMPDYPINEENNIIIDIFLNAGSQRVAIDNKLAEADLKSVINLMGKESIENLVIMSNKDKYGANPRLTLDAFRMYFLYIRKTLPNFRKANLLRHSLFNP